MGSSKQVLLTVSLALLAAAGSFLLPLPETGNWAWADFHSYLALTITVAILFVGTSIIFLKGLDGFTQKLKRAYAFICTGFALLGVSLVTIPLVAYSSILDNLWRDGGLIIVPFAVSLAVLIWGTRSFARLFEIKNASTKIWVILICAVVLSVIIVAMPHVPTATPEAEFDAPGAFNMLNLTVLVFAAAHILQVKKRASYVYANALAWLSIGLIILAFAAVGLQVAKMALGDDQWFLAGALPIVPTFFAGLALLRSSYSFSRIVATSTTASQSVYHNFFGKVKNKEKTEASPSIDIIMYAAGLVSNQTEIEEQREELRGITAQIGAGGKPGSKEEAALKSLYMELERYLLTKEKVRAFDKPTLRQRIAQDLHISGQTPGFWSTL